MQRRLAAIFAADVVGYSRLMGNDEAGTLTAIKARRDEIIDPEIAARHGRIVKLMGDGMLVEFPSVVEAVLCAAAVQRAMAARDAALPEDRRVALRIGVNLCDIIVEDDDIYGDGVNIAARLEGLAEAGGVSISRTVFDQVKNKVELEFEDMGERRVKNIAEPVHVYRIRLEETSAATGGTPTVTSRVGAAAGAPSERPAIAVLPFINMSRDPDQEYFSDGLTEDIITALSHCRSFPVIARNSTFTYKGRAVRAQQVADELGARYLLEGSVRKAGSSRIRVTAQLIDAETGHHLWAAKFDRALEEVFEIQDEITQKIVATIEPELSGAELKKAVLKRPENLTAWDYYLRGMAHIYKETREDNGPAREMFQRALDLDPSYGEAWAGLAWSHLRDFQFAHGESKDRSLADGFSAARKAVDLDDGSSLARFVLGTAYVWAEKLDLGIMEVEKAIELNPFNARAQMALGNRLDLIGRTAEGIAQMERSIELNPRDPACSGYFGYLARAYLSAGDHEAALRCAQRAVSLKPEDADFHYRLAVCLAHLDRPDEALAALQDSDRLSPGFGASRATWRPYGDDERNRQFFAGLERHGLR